MSADIHTDADEVLDVREIDGQPFDPIMTALGELSEGETLLLVNSFEPEPLYEVLTERGFEYETEQRGPRKWHVRIENA
ncbi:DUF2249 domain-containing protein [Natrialba aegyptia]|jgi:uncharacterized protein (DUF2249 family)|uniref:DUF2249 domain-containing protein n=1 Tax=Natrialba aegyptia DSM 13077 TaxID=1227491 RepID=M0APK5_9EURY|nr:DUF2249 domain-containing protein [Natrialba aegyptia]ELZ00262.1 hypothetical protein C480_19172 [Natrialba aegyptia DSM 13077]